MESPMDSSSESTIESPNKNGETLNSIPFPGGKAKSSTLRLKFDKAKAFARSSGADFVYHHLIYLFILFFQKIILN